MKRRLLALIVALGLGAGTWLRSDPPPASYAEKLALVPLPQDAACCQAGPLRLIGAWQMLSPHTFFGGYSALLETDPGRLLALSDRGYFLEFSKPGATPQRPRLGPINADAVQLKANRDVEAAAWDPATRRLWIAQEGRNAIARHRRDMVRETFREVPEMKRWSRNAGPEAMLRLADGRFVVLCECLTGWNAGGKHPGLLFAGDPGEAVGARPIRLVGSDGYRPTDMAQLPDGRVLILVRRLLWPLPPRFAIKLLIADPADLRASGVWRAREVADLTAPWPVDNYEGLAIERDAAGRLIAWIISDDNGAVSQRVLLLKVEIDEAGL